MYRWYNSSRLFSLLKLTKTSFSNQPTPLESQSIDVPAKDLHFDLPSSQWRLDKWNKFLEIPQAWVSSLDKVEENRVGLVPLHPDVFRVVPRIDILHQNVVWQLNYRSVSFVKALTRGEMPGGGRKPWPQKGLGKARHGSIRSPIWIRGREAERKLIWREILNICIGGISHGPRGPRTRFYMLPDAIRLYGLCTALTVKHAQDDLVIVDNFESLPSGDAKYLEDIAESRNWGFSVLFVCKEDVAPKNLALACSEIASFNLMPAYGLNCFSMLKHQTLVLPLDTVEYLQQRILSQLHRKETMLKKFVYKDNKELLLSEGEDDEDDFTTPFV
ncbi:ribosomal protein L4:L1 family protein [Trichuris trichiura]|uniref:Large ribosomal subunit protein uL4m n=1 Tax=Trichuris trichiura TaxID=36087 RepID=A0A077ZML5_TRITR|nr:ribosomal protein L4:L1 family protein [Trichuris trichiura]